MHCAKLKRIAELEVKGVGFLGEWSEFVGHSQFFRTGKVRVTGQRGSGGQGGVFGLESVDAAEQRRILDFTGRRGVVVKTAGKVRRGFVTDRKSHSRLPGG